MYFYEQRLESEREKFLLCKQERDRFAERLKHVSYEYELLSQTAKLSTDRKLAESSLEAINEALITNYRFVEVYKDLNSYIQEH